MKRTRPPREDQLRPDVPPPPPVPAGEDVTHGSAPAPQPPSLMAELLDFERKRAALDIPKTIKLGDKTFSLTSRSFGLLHMIGETLTDLSRVSSRTEGNVLRAVQDAEKGSAGSSAQDLIDRLLDARAAAIKSGSKEEIDLQTKLLQLLVEPTGKEPDPENMALDSETAMWGVGQTEFETILQTFMVRDRAGVSFLLKKAMGLSG